MIIQGKSEAEIKSIVKRIGNKLLKPSSHGFNEYGPKKIIDAAKMQSKAFTRNKDNPAIRVMAVVLAANRNYEKQVRPHVERLKTQYDKLSFKDLQIKLSRMRYEEFGKKVWGHKDKKKYDTLKALVSAIVGLRSSKQVSDLSIMKSWAMQSNLDSRKSDCLGSVPNVGIATFQHLRISFGIDTVKPDQRVKEVLAKEFAARLSSAKAILAVEEIARITGHKVVEIDQMFVKYGSGYY